MKSNDIGRRLTAVLSVIGFVLVLFGGIRAEAKSEREKVVELAAMVRPYDLYEVHDDEVEIAVVLANTKPKIARKADSPYKTIYNEYRLEDFQKTSKRIFGKVIELKIATKKNVRSPVMYYNSENRTIYLPLFYDPGDTVIFTKHREVKTKDGSFEVSNYDVTYHWSGVDRRPTKVTKIKIKPSPKYGYIITSIKREELPLSKMDLSKKAVDKQIKQIKEWYNKPTSADRKEGYERDKIKYSMLYHDDNLVFVVKNDGDKVFRYYYKYGVLIHAIESTAKGNKTLKTYEAYFKNGDYYINNHNVFRSPDWIEELTELIKDADQTFEILVNL